MFEKINNLWGAYQNNWSLSEKKEFFKRDDRYFDILFSQQFDRLFLDHLCRLTNKIRQISKTSTGATFLRSLLANKKAMLYFDQVSTRTFLSFQSACSTLGMQISEVRDTTTSSEMKGESKIDTIRTFSSYADLLIMRTQEEKFSEKTALMLNKSRRPIPVINAGSGKDQHPTQALLDIYTLQRSFKNEGGLQNKIILFCGDLKRGRTVRSLTELLTNYYKISFIFCSPENLKIEQDLKKFLVRDTKVVEVVQLANFKNFDALRIPVFLQVKDLNKFLPFADAVYMTRIQDEHDAVQGETKKSYSDFCLTPENVKLMKPGSVIMHPLPRRDEINDEIDDDPRAMYWRQVRNGMWVRTALIAYLFKMDNKIMEF